MRTATLTRNTKETQIRVEVNLDGTGVYSVGTGIGFFDHMLEQLSRHSGMDLSIQANGDIHIDDHHIIEDVGLALGQALSEALGDKKGIGRYGYFYCPMDETLARTVVDLSGRPYCVFNARFDRAKIGTLSSEMIREFFIALSNTLKANIHTEILYGINDHHKAEALFKSFARAFRQASALTGEGLPTTKGVL
ncbi:MAG: imidazoleglycerol-phosphate dehydratase HisB [Bacteroidetes bacterium]|nr:imidazoleglycerol-phosphate dehydratase HisB [Bacteroidota bacterium]